MATYDGKYSHTSQKRLPKTYVLLERVIDFAQKPITSGEKGKSGSSTTAWAAGDVLKAIKVKAGSIVLGVQVEIQTPSSDSGDYIKVGYGSDTDRWGRYNLNQAAGPINYPATSHKDNVGVGFGEPHIFVTADTVDVVIDKAAIQGKVRLIVHVLEPDRRI